MKQEKVSDDKYQAVKNHTMKIGDYELHVLVEASSSFNIEGQSSIDAMISVNAFGDTQYSKVKKGVGLEQLFWGEHFFFTKTFDSTTVSAGQELVLSVWDRNRILKNSLVGSYQIDLQRIYAQKNHVMNHIWLAITNITVDYSTISGYVKISVSLKGQNDKDIELNVEKIDSLTKEKKVLMPPSIQKTSYQLYAEVIEGKSIKPTDGDTADPFIGIEFGQIFDRTKPQVKNCNPKFNTKIYVPMILPAITDNIAIRLLDANIISKNEVIGSSYINITDLMQDKEKKHGSYHWIHFYGPQLNTNDEEQKNIFQFFPALAPYYVGSVLMKLSLTENSKPVRKIQEMKEVNVPKMPLVAYEITVRFLSALNLNNGNKKHRASLRIGDKEIKTDFADTQNGFCVWVIQKSMVFTNQENQDIPDVFIYLINNSDERVCFLRQKFKQGVVFNEDWKNLKPDTSVVKYEEEQAGYIKVGVSIRRRNNAEFNNKAPIDRPINSNIKRAFQNRNPRGKILVELISAQDLLPLDEEGASDPYIQFNYNQNQITSTVKKQTLNPIYFEKLALGGDVDDKVDDQFPIVINVYDKDTLKDQFLGSAFVDLTQGLKNKSVVYGLNNPPTPAWFPLKNSKAAAGKILASFIILENGNVNYPKTIDIPFKEYNIMTVILGLRGMKSTGLISVKRPYLQLDFQSLNVYNASNANNGQTKNIITEPKGDGPNVDIKMVNKSTVMLPQNKNYWPSLSGIVNDHILGGVYEPILGFFSINLKNAFQRSNLMKQKIVQCERIGSMVRNPLNRIPARLTNLSPALIINMRAFLIACLNYRWETMSKDIVLNSSKSTDKMIPSSIVILPLYIQVSKDKYKEEYRDIINKNEDYMAIGFDKKETRSVNSTDKRRNKHYRFVLNEPYEDYYHRINKVTMGMYDDQQVRRGRIISKKDLTEKIMSKVVDEDSVVGNYKGNCYIMQNNQIMSDDDKKFVETTKKALQTYMQGVKIYMYLYIIEGFDMPAKDLNGTSDPYLIVKMGPDVINLKKKYIAGTNNPQFNELIKKQITFPRHSSIEIEIWDHDTVKNDELIGSAVIDVQNRVFAQMGQFDYNNPIQTHKLKAVQSKLSQGGIRFWMDLVKPSELAIYRQFDIHSQPASDFEVRMIVWSCDEIPNGDSIEQMSDLYVQSTFNNDTQSTDVHYRSADGMGNYNWRCVYPIKLPLTDPTISLRVYDKDFLNKDDYLCSGTFSIQSYLEDALENQESTKLYLGDQDLSVDNGIPSAFIMELGQKKYDRFKIKLYGREADSQTNALKQQGTVQISIEIMKKEEALLKPVGKGRNEPNQFPKLPEPAGRLQFSLNPLTMLKRLCGKVVIYKVLCILCIVIVIIVIYNLVYSFGGGVLANLFTK